MLACQRCGEGNPERARFCLACGASIAARSVPRGEERKRVSVLFCDLACDLTLGVLGWPAIEVGGHGAGWAGQAAFAVVGGLLLGFLAGFLTAG
jgi:hypothetical protein